MPACRKCRDILPLESFGLKGSSKTIRRKACNKCYASAAIQWNARNPARVYAARRRFVDSGGARNSWLVQKYGINNAQYDQLLAKQGGRCAICDADRPGGKWTAFHVDHDHLTGRVRGLLCTNCNRGLGYFGDDPKRMICAAGYLSKEQT